MALTLHEWRHDSKDPRPNSPSPDTFPITGIE